MAGNVWEWTASDHGAGEMVLHAGSFASRRERRQAHIGLRTAGDA